MSTYLYVPPSGEVHASVIAMNPGIQSGDHTVYTTIVVDPLEVGLDSANRLRSDNK